MTRESRREWQRTAEPGTPTTGDFEERPGARSAGSRVGPCVNDSLEVPLCIVWIPQLEVEGFRPDTVHREHAVRPGGTPGFRGTPRSATSVFPSRCRMSAR